MSEVKRRKVEGAGPLAAFLDWCDHSGIEISPKVYVTDTESEAQYGMMAREDLAVGETIFTIPRSSLLSPETGRLQRYLQEDSGSLQSASGWVPLLLTLLYEATDAASPWAPYFRLWPQLEPPDLPMFWSAEEREELLAGTGVVEAVQRDLTNIEREYRTIALPFIQRHPKLLTPETHTLDLYKRLVAFIMAYSFQEPLDEDDDEEDSEEAPPPMMVPVADLLNHVALHNAQLEFMPECLRMVTIRAVPAGAELYNTYGQMGSWQLLHMYGFCEPHPRNVHDTADIRMTMLRDAAVQGANSEEEQVVLRERWGFLQKAEMVTEGGAFVFGCEEVLTNDELRTCLKVLCMSAEEFLEFRENDGWEDDDDEEEEELTYQELPGLPLSWRQLLNRSAELALATYPTDLASDQWLLDDPATYSKLTSRGRYALQVRYGQKRILQRLRELCAS